MGLFAARTKAGNAFGYEKAPAPAVKRGAGALGFSTRPLGWGLADQTNCTTCTAPQALAACGFSKSAMSCACFALASAT